MNFRLYLNPLAHFVRAYLRPFIPQRLRQKIYWWLNPPDPRKQIDLVFDIVGSCNLRCPSCPVGSIGPVNAAGKMNIDTYRNILKKANQEYVIRNLVLYNWGEAILHPQLPAFISLAKEMGIYVSLSSNLNILRGVEALLNAKPDAIRISLSGFTQPIYSQTHKGGDIEVVKSNMRLLSETKRAVGNTTTEITVYYHKYIQNIDELPAMKAFTKELGFTWAETWAYYMPFEKVADFAEGKLPESEMNFIDSKLALPLGKAIEAAKKFKSESCSLLNNQIVLDLNGNLILCCAVYDYEKNKLGSFLELNEEQIKKLKGSHPSCDRCTSHGLHKYLLWEGHPKLNKEYEQLVKENLELRNQPTRSGIKIPIIQSN